MLEWNYKVSTQIFQLFNYQVVPCDCIAGHAAAFSDGMHDSEVNKFSNFSNLHDTTERSDITWTYEVEIVNYFS